MPARTFRDNSTPHAVNPNSQRRRGALMRSKHIVESPKTAPIRIATPTGRSANGPDFSGMSFSTTHAITIQPVRPHSPQPNPCYSRCAHVAQVLPATSDRSFRQQVGSNEARPSDTACRELVIDLEHGERHEAKVLSRPSPRMNEGLVEKWIGDGRPLLAACSGALVFAGGFALFIALAGDFLPHDVGYLGLTADELCRIECRIVDFMVHDRAAFGGALIGIGVLYLWLVTFPLAEGEAWAWWTLAVTGALGFASFLSYLGYGYLDTWHGIGTLLLLPVFCWGLIRNRSVARSHFDLRNAYQRLLRVPRDRVEAGVWIILVGAAGTTLAGLMILSIGVTDVFVPEDTHFIGMARHEVDEISPRLVPLIAHDRAGFGGAVAVMGLTTFLVLMFARPSRSLLQAIGVAGLVSLGAAITIHFVVGYKDLWHLTPPALGALSLVVGEALAYPPAREGRHGMSLMSM
jgi:hypothetical protein